MGADLFCNTRLIAGQNPCQPLQLSATKMLAVDSDGLSSVFRTNVVEGENHLSVL